MNILPLTAKRFFSFRAALHLTAGLSAILTGCTVERPQRGGGFEFDPNRHEPGTKKALGQKFKDKGEEEGR